MLHMNVYVLRVQCVPCSLPRCANMVRRQIYGKPNFIHIIAIFFTSFAHRQGKNALFSTDSCHFIYSIFQKVLDLCDLRKKKEEHRYCHHGQKQSHNRSTPLQRKQQLKRSSKSLGFVFIGKQ